MQAILEKMKNNPYYYGFAHELDYADRVNKFTKQYEERGFDDTELWNLDNTFLSFMIAKIKEFKASHLNYPEDKINDLNKMLLAFELMNAGIITRSPSEDADIEAGFNIFITQCALYRSYEADMVELYASFFAFFIPRIKRFRNVVSGCPMGLEKDDEWEKILDKIILGIDLLIYVETPNDAQSKDINTGLTLLSEYYGDLWD